MKFLKTSRKIPRKRRRKKKTTRRKRWDWGHINVTHTDKNIKNYNSEKVQ